MSRMQTGLLTLIGLAISSIPIAAAVEMPAAAIGSAAGQVSGTTRSLAFTAGLAVSGIAENVNFQESAGFWWWLQQAVSDVEVPESAPAVTEMAPAGPNPFTVIATLRYQIAAGSTATRARLEIFDVAGRSVSTLVNDSLSPGVYTATWNREDRLGRRVANGVYFARFQAGSYARTVRLVAAD